MIGGLTILDGQDVNTGTVINNNRYRKSTSIRDVPAAS
jgi:hypothetical protein